jgi:hypothetical protein
MMMPFGVLAFLRKTNYNSTVSVTGKVKNGVVVLPRGTVLPEGAQVTIQIVPANDPLAAAIENLAKPREHLPPDYALNHGHYVGGEPKR